MDSGYTEAGDEQAVVGTPEDVAVLYSWANLQGAKYRDFSASRREYRAQVRYRAAQALRERELRAQAAAEASAAAAEQAALDALAEARAQDTNDNRALRMQSMQSMEEAAQTASSERMKAARRAEAAAHAAAIVLHEEREIAQAQASARRQTLRYAESEMLLRHLTGPQPRGTMLQFTPKTAPDSGLGLVAMGPGTMDRTREGAPAEDQQRSVAETEDTDIVDGPMGPAWLYATQTLPQMRLFPVVAQADKGEMSEGRAEVSGGETLLDSRELVATRRFALQQVFERAETELPTMQPLRPSDGRTPLLAVFSLAGGVGKTSLVATLGRALSAQGEKVLLIDTTSRGLLPFYFGERGLRPGVVRSYLPSKERAEAPISLAVYDAAKMSEDTQRQQALTEEILRNGEGNQRVMLDLSLGSHWLVRSMAKHRPTVLVPMMGDMNSVVSLHAVENIFRTIVDADGQYLLPFYVLNQFDASLPLHLDVREVLRRQLGDRLLQFVVRRSPAVSEALADGMTVLDYAPEDPVSQDYNDVAAWLRNISPAATAEIPNLQRRQR